VTLPTADAAFVPVDDTDAFAKEVVSLLRAPAVRGEGDQRAVAQKWRAYADGLVSIVRQMAAAQK